LVLRLLGVDASDYFATIHLPTVLISG